MCESLQLPRFTITTTQGVFKHTVPLLVNHQTPGKVASTAHIVDICVHPFNHV